MAVSFFFRVIETVGEDVYNQLTIPKKLSFIRGYMREKEPVKEASKQIAAFVEWYKKENVMELRSTEVFVYYQSKMTL